MAKEKKLYKVEQYHPKARLNSVMQQIEKYGEDALVRERAFATQVIWGGVLRRFNAGSDEQNAAFKKGFFLFRLVRQQAAKYLESNGGTIKMPKQYPNSAIGKESDRHHQYKITRTDLNHAYWRIFFNLGIITEKTYNAGLPVFKKSERKIEEAFKGVRNAAMSTVGKGQEFNVIRNGVRTNETVVVNRDPELAKIYAMVRYTCYKHMHELSRLLGEDFIRYDTDCITYVYSKESRQLIETYLKAKNLPFKHYTIG